MLPADRSPKVREILGFEYRYIHRRLARRGYGDKLEQLPDAEVMLESDLYDLVHARSDVRMLHVSGRCGSDTPRLSDDLCQAIRALHGEHALACLVLNTHHDPAQAESLAERVPFVVAMAAGVANQVATVFAGHFYVELARTGDVALAFDDALEVTNVAFAGRSPTLLRRSTRTRISTPARERISTPARERISTPARARTHPPLPPLRRREPSALTKPSPGSASESTLAGRVPISDDETELLLEAIEDHAGISLSINSDRFLLRLSSRLDALGLSNYREYYRYLYFNENGPAEMEELIETITTHETYFFREQLQLDALSTQLLPQLAKRRERERSLKIWSAGCSTGEELHTLAILLLESGLFTHWDISLIGTDISQRVIDTARAAIYGQNSFRTISKAHHQTYFKEIEHGRWQVRDDLREMCRFDTLNLLHADQFDQIGTQDIILCRNVLIYLSPQTRQRAVGGFYEHLVPGGHLLLGASESLRGLRTRFETVSLGKSLVYRKPNW